MDEVLLQSVFAVRNIRGIDEYEIYNNYINDLPQSTMLHYFYKTFQDDRLKVKDDLKSLQWRKRGNVIYKNNNCEASVKLYTKSLRYSTYNSESYALALANRSAAFFALADYQSCLKDINLCLNAKYSTNLKLKVYFRKAECYRKMGEASHMRETLTELQSFIDETATVPMVLKEKYRDKIKNMMAAPVDAKSDPQESFNELPVLEANATFHNASPSLVLKYSKNSGFHVYAKKEIAIGEVVLVDKAYAFSPCYTNGRMNSKMRCHYCAMTIASCVPCKSCVKHIYCTEECRDLAWDEFHQWECVGIQSGFLTQMWVGYLALRIILKATHKGLSTTQMNFKDGVANYGKKDDIYPYIYNLSSPLNKLQKYQLMHCAATAAVVVHYLALKTNFFTHLKKWPAYANKSDQELMNKVGGLMIRHLAQFRWNGVLITDFEENGPSMVDLFLSVCPSMALMNHSCDPNTSHYFVGDTVVVKAMKNIKPNEELCYAYMNATYRLVATRFRNKMLEKLNCIKCKCDACINPKMDLEANNAYLCIKCNGSAISEKRLPILGKECVCLDCNYRYPLPYDVYVKEKIISQLLRHFTNGEGDINYVYKSLAICKTIYKRTHNVFQVAYEELMKYYHSRGDINNFMTMGRMVYNHAERLFTRSSLGCGYLYYCTCVGVLQLLEKVAVDIDLQNLQEVLNDFMELIDKGKFVFNLHYPAFIENFHKMEKQIFQFRVLHVIRIAISMEQSKQ